MKFLKQKYTKTENLMLINMLYNKKRNKKEDDSIDIIYKDLSTGKKYLEHIKNPPMEICNAFRPSRSIQNDNK